MDSRTTRTLLLLAAGLVVAVVAGLLLYTRDTDGNAAGGAPAASATPTVVTTMPELPAGCPSFLASYRLDDRPRSLVARPSTIEIQASDCAVAAWADLPVEDLGLTIAWQLQPPDGPRDLEVMLPADRSAGGLAWRGTVVYPDPGVWEPVFRLGAIEERAGYVEVLDADLDLSERPGLPVTAMTLPLTVVDAAGRPVTTWAATQSDGIGWLRNGANADAARAVWVQQRGRETWVVAGDLDTAEVTPLLEVRADPAPRLTSAPDGRAVVIVELARGDAPMRVRLVRHDLTTIALSSMLDPDRTSHPSVSWAPDAQTLVVVGEALHVLNDDGTTRFSSPEGSRNHATVTWAADSRSALVMLDRTGSHGAPTQRLVRVDLDAGTVQTVLDYGGGIGRGFYGHPASISPDGTRIAFTWVDTTADRAPRLAVLPADQPFAPSLAAATVVSIPSPLVPQDPSYIASPQWSPDGQWIAFVMTERAGDGDPPIVSRVALVHAESGERRELSPARGGFYIDVVWLPDGSGIAAQRLSAIQSHGGTSSVDVFDVSSGAVAHTYDGAGLSVATGDEQLIAVAGELVATSGAGPRTLLRPTGVASFSAVVPSPDDRYIGVLGSVGSAHTVGAVARDGSGHELLGAIERGPSYPAAWREGAVLAPDSGGAWAWLSLEGESSEPLPLPSEASTDSAAGRHASLAIAPDGRQVAYWTWVHADDPLPRLTVLDTETDATRLIEVPLQRPDPTSRGPLAWTPEGDRLALVDGQTLITVDLVSGDSQTVDLTRAGVRDAPPLPGAVAFIWDESGQYVDIVWGRQLWRVDPPVGTATATTSSPSPGGWWGAVALTRSPDGSMLAAGTPFGVFVQEDDGTWRRISRVAVAPQQRALVWSPDGTTIAYAAEGGRGILVAAVDGSDVYELVTTWSGGALLALSWLPDGRIVYGVLIQGI